jgi:hypothetical protein
MQNFVGYLIAATFFIGGYGICSIDWSTGSDHPVPIPCGGPKPVWQRPAADRTADQTSILLPHSLYVNQKNELQVEERTHDPDVVAEPRQPKHFC